MQPWCLPAQSAPCLTHEARLSVAPQPSASCCVRLAAAAAQAASHAFYQPVGWVGTRHRGGYRKPLHRTRTPSTSQCNVSPKMRAALPVQANHHAQPWDKCTIHISQKYIEQGNRALLPSCRPAYMPMQIGLQHPCQQGCMPTCLAPQAGLAPPCRLPASAAGARRLSLRRRVSHLLPARPRCCARQLLHHVGRCDLGLAKVWGGCGGKLVDGGQEAVHQLESSGVWASSGTGAG